MNNTIPMLFVPECIRKIVKNDSAGVYVLGNEKEDIFVPKYVGRSDYSIKNRLLTHNHMYDYEYFIFKYVSGAEQAFITEAKWWHDCINNGFDIDNKIHPDTPSGIHVKCPYCSFVYEMKNILE